MESIDPRAAPMPPARSVAEARNLRQAREVEAHLKALDTFAPMALGVLAVASGIYTYLGVISLLDDSSPLSFFAAIAYSLAVSVAIFVFWSYLLRLLPAVHTARARLGLLLSMALGSLAIIAMSSWLNAAALAGTAAVEQHLARTVQGYQEELERANRVAVAAQGLALDVARVQQSFEDLRDQEAGGNLSGTAGRGAVFRVLTQKADELRVLEEQIAAQGPAVEAAFAEGNSILSRMRELSAGPGTIEDRSVRFAEESVRLAGVIARLRQLSVAPLVSRAAQDLAASVVLPELDGSTEAIRGSQQSTIQSVVTLLDRRAEGLRAAAEEVLALPVPEETTYTPISTADAVLRYAGDFIPSWAGAISIDLLPAVLVFIMMVAQAAIRADRQEAVPEEMMTLAELRAALTAMRSLEAGAVPEAAPRPMAPAGAAWAPPEATSAAHAETGAPGLRPEAGGSGLRPEAGPGRAPARAAPSDPPDPAAPAAPEATVAPDPVIAEGGNVEPLDGRPRPAREGHG